MKDIPEHSKKYWQYEYDVSIRYMAQLMHMWGITVEGSTVLDVGCGEGGGVCGLYDAGAHCTGFDISIQRIGVANLLKGDRAIVSAGHRLRSRPATNGIN